jgi:cytoskeletal protein CcmA (bactofilin family)
VTTSGNLPQRGRNGSPTNPESSIRRQSAPTPPEQCENFLGAGASFTGTLVVEGGMRLEGKFEGDIETNGTLQVTKDAEVHAKIQANFAVIAGSFRGQIRCEQRLDLLSTGRVEAEINTRGITAEEGARLNGRVHMTDSSPLGGIRTSSNSGDRVGESAP